MVKIFILIACVGALVLLIKGKSLYGKKEEEKKEQAKAIDSTNMVKDPICGTYVDEGTKYKVRYYGKVYYFCSEECMEEFKQAKAKETEQSA